MIITELLPTLQKLNHSDKIRALQFLANELAKEENLLEPNKDYPVWSPYNSFEASDRLLEMLKTEANEDVV